MMKEKRRGRRSSSNSNNNSRKRKTRKIQNLNPIANINPSNYETNINNMLAIAQNNLNITIDTLMFIPAYYLAVITYELAKESERLLQNIGNDMA